MDFEVDIHGVYDLTVKYYGIDNGNTFDEAYVCITDFIAQKNFPN